MPKEIKQLTKRQQENLRHQIASKAGSYISLLDQDSEGAINITQGRRASIQILLRKVLPDLIASEVTSIKTSEINPANLQKELMEILTANPALARKVMEIVNKKPRLEAVETQSA
jgi:hypothetical protein